MGRGLREHWKHEFVPSVDGLLVPMVVLVVADREERAYVEVRRKELLDLWLYRTSEPLTLGEARNILEAIVQIKVFSAETLTDVVRSIGVEHRGQVPVLGWRTA